VPESLPTPTPEGAREPGAVPLELERPAGELGPEGDRLRVYAVRPADHDGVAVLLGAADGRRERAVEPLREERARFAHLEGERRVEDVRRGQAIVEPARGRPDLLGHRVDGRGDVVLMRSSISATCREGGIARARSSSAASFGTTPSSAHASVAASSTSSQRASRDSSDQTAFMAGRE
jgi:hypothetical protein